MRFVSEIEDSHKDEFNDMKNWAEELYNSQFSCYFENQRNIQLRMDNSETAITNEELEIVLVDVPMALIEVAEKVNDYRLRIESIKLSIKSKQALELESSPEAKIKILEDKLLIAAYESVLSRVDKQISYSKELIMGCKKIWDGRQHQLNSMPVGMQAGTSNSQDIYDSLPEW